MRSLLISGVFLLAWRAKLQQASTALEDTVRRPILAAPPPRLTQFRLAHVQSNLASVVP